MADDTSNGPRTLETPAPQADRFYTETRQILELLPGRDVLYWLEKAYAAAAPYRPTFDEAIISAGHIASGAP